MFKKDFLNERVILSEAKNPVRLRCEKTVGTSQPQEASTGSLVGQKPSSG